MASNRLGQFGFAIDVRDDGSHVHTALTVEGLGFGTLWINGGQLDRLDRLTDLLTATNTVSVGSAIIPPDRYGPAEVARLFERAETDVPGRLMIGLGSSHRPDALASLGRYVDALHCVPQGRRLLAAFGPHALAMARRRFAGAMPMLFTADQTGHARTSIGPDRTLAVGLYVVLDENPETARATARRPLEFLTTLPGYRKSLARQGFSHADITDVSAHLVDSLIAWGSPRQALDHANRLRAAGADHVWLTVLGGDGQPTGQAAARMLAAEFG